MSSLVVLDTMICIWGLKGEAKPGQEHKIQETLDFLAYLDDNGLDVGISAVTLSELLVLVDESNKSAFARTVEDQLTVLPFDVPSALSAASIFKNWLDRRAPNDEKSVRQVVKADCQILGTAVAVGAATLYTEDAQIQKMAHGYINTKPIPRNTQPALFYDNPDDPE